MKRKTFAVLFSILLISAGLFASCNANQPIFGNDATPIETTAASAESQKIKDLENRIIALQQTLSISDTESREELLRLQALLSELKESVTDMTDKETDSTPTEPPAQALFLYTVENGEATITGYTGTDTHLTIPTVIDGYVVTAIADSAFSSDTLQSVVIPNGITKIGWFAFSDCSLLTAVTLPSSVSSIGYSAFPSSIKGFTIYCHGDSFAQRYAASYGMSYTII
ncbi:MAG: leucine-rich repeat protein [Clostridia bacterium]|nr:leucine-rich repeat protein [Clostridia bacterium]